jgi:hypothetical protein
MDLGPAVRAEKPLINKQPVYLVVFETVRHPVPEMDNPGEIIEVLLSEDIILAPTLFIDLPLYVPAQAMQVIQKALASYSLIPHLYPFPY